MLAHRQLTILLRHYFCPQQIWLFFSSQLAHSCRLMDPQIHLVLPTDGTVMADADGSSQFNSGPQLPRMMINLTQTLNLHDDGRKWKNKNKKNKKKQKQTKANELLVL